MIVKIDPSERPVCMTRKLKKNDSNRKLAVGKQCILLLTIHIVRQVLCE